MATPQTPLQPGWHFCHPFYGTDLIQSQCLEAANLLPYNGGGLGVDDAMFYVTTPQERYDGPFRLPLTINVGKSSSLSCLCWDCWDSLLTRLGQPGECYITLEAAGPDVPPAIWIKPIQIHIAALTLIMQCIEKEGSPNTGGFVAFGFNNLMEWIFHNGAGGPNWIPRGAPYPAYTSMVTVTMSGPSSKDTQPGNFDPVVATIIQYTHAEISANAPGSSSRAITFGVGAEVWSEKAESMERGGTTPWWNSIPMSSAETVYECDAALGRPSVVDCEQLEWSQLGSASDTLSIRPEQTTFVHFNTCYLAISASLALVLDWTQIRAAVLALLNVCVYNPLYPPQGGRAYHGARTNSRRRDLGDLDALPVGANISIFEQSEAWTNQADELQTCAWKAVLEGSNTSLCSAVPHHHIPSNPH